MDTNELNALLDAMKAHGFGTPGGDEDAEFDLTDEEFEAKEAAKEAIRIRARKVFTGLVTGSAQAVLALALLEKIQMSKRKIGALGMFLSVVNIASMLPPLDVKITGPPKAKLA